MLEINKKRYRDLDSYYKKIYHKKIIKLPLDGGFSCPNRDGTLSREGCLFCSDRGSGEWSLKNEESIKKQIAFQKKRLAKEGRDEAYIAYFQNFTNTYAKPSLMRKLFESAIAEEDVIGLSLATRADCLQEDVLEMLEDLNTKTDLTVELGMQSVNEDSIRLINRGYDHKIFDRGLLELKKRQIKTIIHIIVGLPFEDEKDFLNDIDYINRKRVWGIKIHNLYVEKDSRIEKFYKKNKISYTMTQEDYVNIVVSMLRRLDSKIIVNRLTGDGIREKISFPLWSKNKGKILTSIDKMMKDNNYMQGDLCKKI